MSMESFALKVTSNGVWSNKFTMVLMGHIDSKPYYQERRIKV